MGAKPQHDPAYRRLCKRLLEWRQSAGLTQRALAIKLRKPHSYVYKAEVGNRRIDPIELGRWCIACKVDPRDVLDVMNLTL